MINISQWSDYWCRSLKPFIINNLYYTSSIESVCPAMTLYWTEIWAALTSKSSPFLSFSKIIHKYILITQKNYYTQRPGLPLSVASSSTLGSNGTAPVRTRCPVTEEHRLPRYNELSAYHGNMCGDTATKALVY